MQGLASTHLAVRPWREQLRSLARPLTATPPEGPGMRAVFGVSGPENSMEAFLFSTGVVALGEMGDKTQLLAFVLAAKFKRPLPIVLGILSATLVNHTAAGALGAWIAKALGPDILRWVIGLGFLAMAGWMLIPDKPDDKAADGIVRFG